MSRSLVLSLCFLVNSVTLFFGNISYPLWIQPDLIFLWSKISQFCALCWRTTTLFRSTLFVRVSCDYQNKTLSMHTYFSCLCLLVLLFKFDHTEYVTCRLDLNFINMMSYSFEAMNIRCIPNLIDIIVDLAVLAILFSNHTMELFSGPQLLHFSYYRQRRLQSLIHLLNNASK